MANEQCFSSFKGLEVEFLCPIISDHTPTIITFVDDVEFGPEPFKFHLKSSEYKDCLCRVQKFSYGTEPMKAVCQKLKMLNVVSKKINTKHFSNISQRVQHTKEQLCEVQCRLQNSSFDDILQQEKRALILQYIELRLIEKQFFKAKSRVKWLTERDQNTFLSQNYETTPLQEQDYVWMTDN